MPRLRPQGFSGATFRDMTCGAWCADPATSGERAGATCLPERQAVSCDAPRALVGWFYDVANDPARLCRSRCVRREYAPGGPQPGDVAAMAYEEGQRQVAAVKAAGRDVALTLADWTGILDKYRKAKAWLPTLRDTAARLPASHPYVARVRAVEEKVAFVDPNLAASGAAGLGRLGALPAALPAAAVVIPAGVVYTAGGVVVIGVIATAIYFIVSETAELIGCATAASGMSPADKAAFLDACRRSGWPPWVKALVGIAAVGAAGWVAYRRWGRQAARTSV